MDNTTRRLTLRTCAALMALALPLAACGGDDDATDSAPSTAAESTSGTDSGDAGSTDPEAEAEAEEMIEDALSGDGQSFGLDLETRVSAIESVLEIEGYSIDGSTLTLELAEDSGPGAGMTECIAAGAVLEDDETLVLRFADGVEETCA